MKILTKVDQKKMNESIEVCIRDMEEPGHKFPARFQGRDYIIALAVVAVCAAMIIGGYYL